jgi:hypothetical protein
MPVPAEAADAAEAAEAEDPSGELESDAGLLVWSGWLLVLSLGFC